MLPPVYGGSLHGGSLHGRDEPGPHTFLIRGEAFACLGSGFDCGGELLQVSPVAAQLLRQPGHDRLGGGHLAVDHLEQLHRIDVQLRPELVDIGVPGHA
jgi:hypothetical protein